MSSPRKRFQGADAPPVTTVPNETAAQLPEPVSDAKPPEMPKVESSPADEAGKAALKQRLAEMENAERFTREAVSQHPQYATEPQEPQQPPAMPARVEKWLADHPQYLDPNDSVAQAEIHLATVKCMRDGKTWDAPDFIDTIERHLGLAPATATNGQTRDMRVESRPSPPAPAPQVAPPRQRMSVNVSAPPTREVPSYSTGRAPSHRAPLNADELYIAQQSGQTPEQYQEQKEKLRRLKESGAIQ
jgi:hypothetical protein